jgi:hypothetical protein
MDNLMMNKHCQFTKLVTLLGPTVPKYYGIDLTPSQDLKAIIVLR